MNLKETVTVLAVMSTAWPSAKLQENTAEVWTDLVADVHPDDGLAAARSLGQSSKFFPSVSEFREAAALAKRTRTEEVTVALPRGGRTEAEREHARKCLAEARRLIRENAWKPARPVKGFKTLGESMGEMLRSVPVDDGWIEDARALSPTGRPLRPDDAA